MKRNLAFYMLYLTVTTVLGFSMKGDFLTGFESGIFLSENSNLLSNYNCKEAVIEDKNFIQFKEMLEPVK